MPSHESERDRWNASEGPGRVSPRECVRAAQEQFNLAYSQAEYEGAVIFIRHGVDWLRRALEQMA